MIKRILDPAELSKIADDLHDLFKDHDKEFGHQFLTHEKDSIVRGFANKHLLAWDVFIWANKENDKYDAVIIFINDKSIKFGKAIFSEFLWLSRNPRAGFKLLKTGVNFAREKGFEYIMMSASERNPQSFQLTRIYQKLGFKKDSEIYTAKL
jgi:hypothetical protein